jgi:hypothetical protein
VKKGRFGRKTALIAVVVIAAIVVGVALWQAFPLSVKPQGSKPSANFPAVHLTLVASNGTRLVLDSAQIGNLASYEAHGGCRNNLGNINSLGNYTGVPLETFCDLVGGISGNSSLRVTGFDSSETLGYDQVKGQFATYDNVTGQEEPHNQSLTPILAYYMGDANLSATDGPLMLAIVGAEGLATNSSYWVRNVAELEILNSSELMSRSINLPPMNLTLVALNGTQLVLNEKDIGRLPSFESEGGFKTSAGALQGIGNYTGAQLSTLLALVGGMNSDCSLNVSASDGYSMVYTYDQVHGQNYTTYSPATGDEVIANQPFTVILAYYENGVNLTSDMGPLRLATVGPQGLLTDGHFWIKWVTRLEIRPAVADWTLVLIGPYSDNMTRASFESGLNCQTANHGANWTDSNNNVWSGMPLWYLIGWIDDKGDVNRMEFNDTLAKQGYTVKVITGQGYSESFNSSTIARNDNIILADKLNGAPLPEIGQYWPLRLVGSGLSNDEMLSNVVEIQMIVPGS